MASRSSQRQIVDPLIDVTIPLHHLAREFASAIAREWHTALRGQLTREGLYLRDDARGENRADARTAVRRGGLRAAA